MIRFKVSTSQTGRRRDVGVVIYDRVEDMQRAAGKYRAADGSFEGAQAVSQPRFGERVEADGSVHSFRGCGLVRLVRGQGAGVLAHEMVHMALAIYREDFAQPKDPTLDREDEAHRALAMMDTEETLCHLVSDLVTATNRKMWKLGVYQ